MKSKEPFNPSECSTNTKLAGCELQGVMKLVQVTYSLPTNLLKARIFVTLGTATFAKLNSTIARCWTDSKV